LNKTYITHAELENTSNSTNSDLLPTAILRMHNVETFY